MSSTKERKSQTKSPKAREKKAGRNAYINSKSLLILFVMFLILFALYCSVCTPKQYDLKVGSIAHETINATKDVIDEVTTEERRESAAKAVEPTYTFQEGVKEEVLNTLNSVFNELRTVLQYSDTLRSGSDKIPSSFTDTEIEYAQSLVSSVTLNRYQISTLLRTSPERFEEMVSLVTTAVENSLNTTVREGQLEQSIENIRQIVGYKLDISLNQNILPVILRTCLKPNMIIEHETTELARENARNSVEAIVYLQGQNIIREGDRVTTSKLEMLRSLGLLKDNRYDFSIYWGALLIVFLSVICYIIVLRLLDLTILNNPQKLSVSAIIIVLSVIFGVIAHLFFNAYIVPLVFGPILLTVLLGTNAGIAGIIPLAILISGLAAGNNSTFLYEMILQLLMALSGGLVVIRFLHRHPQRIRVLLAGLLSSVISIAVIVSVKCMTSAESLSLLTTCLWAFGGGFLSGILALSLQPVFEATFRLATPSKLLELANPNQPLLRRLLLEAPGTYHHSIIVANLAEAAAERIGANPYLCRTAGYYHDIGKLKRPGYFKENQMGENPHDKTDPYVSAAILTSHTKDGYQLGQKNRLPSEILNIILQHHGDTPVMFFYHKALQLSDGNPVDINDFRYDGPKPDTKESAIVMLADTVEAAVRSMPDPTPKAIEQFIERLIRGKLEDGQLSNSPISLRDIDEICDAFSGVLRGVFHERIEYPEVRHHIPVHSAVQQAASAASAAETRTPNYDQAKEAAESSEKNSSETIELMNQENQSE